MDIISEEYDVGFGPQPAYYYIVAVVIAYFAFTTLLPAKPPHRAAAADSRPKRVREPVDENRTFTTEQLKAYNGVVNPLGPIYLCVKGVVYDMTAGENFYGPSGPYGCFAGRDASRALAKMDLQEQGTSISDLGPGDLSTLQDWVDKFEMKYPRVGRLVD